MIDLTRYAPGGDLYAAYTERYGTAGAQRIYSAAQTGDRTAITDAIAAEKYGAELNDSTASIFVEQITTDPLAAPFESAENLLENSAASLFRNPLVLLVIVGVVIALLWPVLMPLLKRAR